MHSTHEKGLIGELEFSLHLIKKGYTLLKPLNNNSSYDMVIEKGNVFTRIQIKYCTPLNGRLRVELTRPKRKTKSYLEREVDAMGVFDSKNLKFYLIPMSQIKSKSEIWIRVDSPKNHQTKGINNANMFEI